MKSKSTYFEGNVGLCGHLCVLFTIHWTPRSVEPLSPYTHPPLENWSTTPLPLPTASPDYISILLKSKSKYLEGYVGGWWDQNIHCLVKAPWQNAQPCAIRSTSKQTINCSLKKMRTCSGNSNSCIFCYEVNDETFEEGKIPWNEDVGDVTDGPWLICAQQNCKSRQHLNCAYNKIKFG